MVPLQICINYKIIKKNKSTQTIDALRNFARIQRYDKNHDWISHAGYLHLQYIRSHLFLNSYFIILLLFLSCPTSFVHVLHFVFLFLCFFAVLSVFNSFILKFKAFLYHFLVWYSTFIDTWFQFSYIFFCIIRNDFLRILKNIKIKCETNFKADTILNLAICTQYIATHLKTTKYKEN